MKINNAVMGGAKAKGIVYDKINAYGDPIEVTIDVNKCLPSLDCQGATHGFFGSQVSGLRKLTIQIPIIPDQGCQSMLCPDYAGTFLTSLTLKIKTLKIGNRAFDTAFPTNITCERFKIWLAKSCQTIVAPDYKNTPFMGFPYRNNDAPIIYTEHNSRPSGFGPNWNDMGFEHFATVMWGVSESQFDTL